MSDLLQDKKVLAIIIAVVAIIAVVGAFFLLGGYANCYGDATASGGNVTLTYSNDASGSYYRQMADGSTKTLYIDEKTLVGSIEVDLSQVTWQEGYEPSEGSNNVGHAHDNAAAEISENLNSGESDYAQDVSIEYYDANNNPVELTNRGSGFFEYNVSMNGNKLKIDIYEDFQKNYTTPVSNGADYGGVLTTTPDNTNNITKGILTLNFQKEGAFNYTIDVDLSSIFTLQHK